MVTNLLHNNSAAQRWKAELYGNSLVFVNEASGKALDISANVNANGRNVQIWDRNNSTAQRWTLAKTTYHYTNFLNVSSCYNTLNTYRYRAGLGGMMRDLTLENYARQRAQELVSKYSHTRPNGESALTQIQRIKGNVWAAENIAMGYATCNSVMTGWYNSPGHRANMLNRNLTRVGIAGFEYDGYKYWVQVFSS